MEEWGEKKFVPNPYTKYKVVLYIFLSLFLILLLIIIGVYISNSNAEKAYIKDQLTLTKCESLCPDNFCWLYCKSEYQRPSAYYGFKDTSFFDKEPWKSINDKITECLNLKQINNSNYAGCFDQLFNSTQDIINLSYFTVPNYPKYNFEITGLVCRQTGAELTFQFTSGSHQIDSLRFIYTRPDGSSKTSNEKIPPFPGETKTYWVNYRDEGLTSISGASAQVVLSNFSKKDPNGKFTFGTPQVECLNQ